MLRVEGLGDSGSEPTHWQGRVDMRACGWVGEKTDTDTDSNTDTLGFRV